MLACGKIGYNKVGSVQLYSIDRGLYPKIFSLLASAL